MLAWRHLTPISVLPRLVHVYAACSRTEQAPGVSRAGATERDQTYRLQHTTRQFTDGRSLMNGWLKPRQGETVLDLGCGTGRLSLQLASCVGVSGRVVGVDPNGSKISAAQANNGGGHAAASTPVSFLRGSCEEAIPLGPFDAVFCSYVLHWIKRKERQIFLRKMFDCLRLGGRAAVLLVPQPYSLDREILSLAIPDRTIEAALGVYFDQPSLWKTLFVDAGFALERFEVTESATTFESLEALMRYMEASIPGGKFEAGMLRDSEVEELKTHYGCRRVQSVRTIVRILAKKV